MEQNHSFKLLDGQFDPSEARSILFTLINSKINFHSMESFGIYIRSSGDTVYHEKRIKELKQTNIDIKQLIDMAAKDGKNLKINGNIEITLVDGSGNA